LALKSEELQRLAITPYRVPVFQNII
jgi:hypothetical protein